jgi:hypothetical protein
MLLFACFYGMLFEEEVYVFFLYQSIERVLALSLMIEEVKRSVDQYIEIPSPATIFYLYAPEDEDLRQGLEKVLSTYW